MTEIELAQIIGPAVLTVLLNIIFYLFIKSRADKSIEQNKIVYGGLFQEKLGLYREILKHISNIKKEVYSMSSTPSFSEIELIQEKNWDFVYFCTINEVFWSKKMERNLMELSNKFEVVQEDYRDFLRQRGAEQISQETFLENIAKYQEHILDSGVFNGFISRIVEEMREDLQIKHFNRSN